MNRLLEYLKYVEELRQKDAQANPMEDGFYNLFTNHRNKNDNEEESKKENEQLGNWYYGRNTSWKRAV